MFISIICLVTAEFLWDIINQGPGDIFNHIFQNKIEKQAATPEKE